MNRAHHLVCASGRWARRVRSQLLPWGLEGVELGDDVLEVGPGFGATTRLLAQRVPRLTALEVEPGYCRRLRDELGDRVEVVQGDGTRMPFPDGRFSAVVCFTMLHHVPSPAAQDRLLGEVARVLRPGGVFAGTDSLGRGVLFRLIHVGDTLVLVDPDSLADRLAAAGLAEPVVDTGGSALRFRARRSSALADASAPAG